MLFRSLSISQPTEMGTVYSLAEMEALIDLGHRHGLVVHIDGARLSNAAVALGTGPGEASGYRRLTEMTGRHEAVTAASPVAGVAVGDSRTGAAVGNSRTGADNLSGADVVCFGGTKNGLMFGEAVVFAPRHDGSLPDTARLRKTRLQLSSKMRYIAAQFQTYVSEDLWRTCALAANAAAARLVAALRLRGIRPEWPADTNAVFVSLPPPVVETLRANRFFYNWEGGTVRWMASWDTTEDDIDGFMADLDRAIRANPDAFFAATGDSGNITDTGTRLPAMPGITGETARLLVSQRELLKSNWYLLDTIQSPESQKLDRPPFDQPVPDTAILTKLPDPAGLELGSVLFRDITATRRSRRRYSAEPISLEELSFLLWASHGVKSVKGAHTFRTVPSGGCTHPLDILVYARRVTGLEPGLYRHLAVPHSLALLEKADRVPGADTGTNGWLTLDTAVDEGLDRQLWNAAALFVWTAVPYRTEYVYTAAAAKIVLLDAGHSCQALYGACEALGLGTCAQGAYDQEKLDAALKIDGVDEFAVYAAPVGRVPAR